MHLLLRQVPCRLFRNDLLAAIEYLVEVKGICKVVVETNGVADPANVFAASIQSIRQFWLDDNMKLPIRLKSIICLVATHRIQAVALEEIFAKQLIYSNKIILNFMDKAGEADIERVRELVQELNPSAVVRR